MTTIERSEPLASKVANLIRKRLHTDYIEHERLPGELELAEELGVSRGTIRQAFSILESEGTVLRRQGDGTYPNRWVLRIKTRAETAYEFTALITSLGYKADIAPVRVEQEIVTDELVEYLQVQPGSSVLAVHKVFLADDNPVIYCSDFVPIDLICEPYEDVELKKPIYNFLADHCRLRVSYILAEFMPVIAESEMVDLLHCKRGEPLAQFDEINFSEANKPVMFARIFYKKPFTRFTILRRKT